ENKTKEIGMLATLLKIHPMKTSYIFLSSHEFNEINITHIQGFASYFSQNIVWGKDFCFDASCTTSLFKNNGKWANVTLDQEFISLSSKLSFGDPTVLKHIAVTATRDQSFASALLKLKSIKAQYNLIGEVFLDSRYRKLLATLQPKTQQALFNGTFKTNDYLLKIGLVINKELFNPLFIEFLSRDRLTHLIEGVNIGIRELLISSLTVKELSIFELLESSVGSIVTREAIAGVLWGENWQDFYSDWALNKQISNLRKKLRTCGYDKEVKVLKTEGFMLV
ncbi:MAG: Transcriptional regulatory protein terminal, partial [Candidatus Parcubacteria bacterium]